MTMENTQLHRYSRHVYFDADEREYVALCSEFPHISAFGETPDEALAELDVALEGALEVHHEEGWPIPEPIAPPEPEALPSGKFVTRLPKTLHAQLARTAKQEGVSLNTLVIALVAQGLPLRCPPGQVGNVKARV
ncbi:MAG: toxin-antitoxin system HicB family antitoxin [Trueperaceae bacterium]|nr:toxin-antitoxin system HicB family antitoxin [Trueperaceae bacterium]